MCYNNGITLLKQNYVAVKEYHYNSKIVLLID